MHDYTIGYYCYCLCIAGHKFYFFVNLIENRREQRGKCIFFFQLTTTVVRLESFHSFMHLPSCFITLIHCFVGSIKIFQEHQGKCIFFQLNKFL